MSQSNPVPACCIPSAKYWCERSLAITITHGSEVSQLVIDRPYAILGSHPAADVRLTQAGVPKRALLLIASSQGLFCRPLEKAYPELGKGVYLTPTDTLTIEGYQIQACAHEVGAAAESIADNSHRVPIVAVVPKDASPYKRRMNRTLQVVGRNRYCDIRLKESSLSACHVALFWCEQRLWVIDLLSGNGTVFKGQKVTSASLTIGEQFQIGTHRLLFYRYTDENESAQQETHTQRIEQPDEAIDNLTAPECSPVSAAKQGTKVVSDAEQPIEPQNVSEPALLPETLVPETFVTKTIVPEMMDEVQPAEPPAIENPAATVFYSASPEEIAQLQEELQRHRSEIDAVRGEMQQLQQEMKAVAQAFAQERAHAQREQEQTRELSERFTREAATFHQMLQSQQKAIAEQRETFVKVFAESQSERGRLSDHLAGYMQQFATLNQAFGQLQAIVNEMRAATEQAAESQESEEEVFTPRLAMAPGQEEEASVAASMQPPIHGTWLRQRTSQLLQPEMGILLRPTPAMRMAQGAGGSFDSNSSMETVVATTGISTYVGDYRGTNASEMTVDQADEQEMATINPVRSRSIAPPDEELTHFVSNRLGQLESNRRHTMTLVWLVAFIFTALLLVGIGVAIKWWEAHPPQP